MADISIKDGEANVKTIREASDVYPLIGFTVAAIREVEGDGIYIFLKNGRQCAADVLYDGASLKMTAPYGIDRDGNRI